MAGILSIRRKKPDFLTINYYTNKHSQKFCPTDIMRQIISVGIQIGYNILVYILAGVL